MLMLLCKLLRFETRRRQELIKVFSFLKDAYKEAYIEAYYLSLLMTCNKRMYTIVTRSNERDKKERLPFISNPT